MLFDIKISYKYFEKTISKICLRDIIPKVFDLMVASMINKTENFLNFAGEWFLKRFEQFINY